MFGIFILPIALGQSPARAEPSTVELPRPDATDPHLWLEEVLGEAPLKQVREWNTTTLDAMKADPRFASMQASALDVLTSDARLATGSIRGDYLYNFWQDPDHVRGIWRRATLKTYLAGEPIWDVIFDVDAVAASEEENWNWHAAHCAPASDRCLIELSRGGTDASVIREFSLTTRDFVKDGFSLPEAKSEVSLLDDDTVLVATDTGADSLTESGYPMQVALWKRGQTVTDATVLLKGQRSDVSVGGFTLRHRGESQTLLFRSHTFYDQEVYRLDEKGVLTQLPLPPQHRIVGLYDDAFIVLLQEDWEFGEQTFSSGELIGLAVDGSIAQTIYDPGKGESIEAVHVAKTSIFVQLLSDVVGEVVRLRPRKGGWEATPLDLPNNGQIAIVSGSDSRDDLLVTFESLTTPVTLLHIDKRDRIHELQALPSFFPTEDIIVEQRFAKSSDGTSIPYFLMARRDVLEAGPAPTIQYGYGGFQAAILPTYFRDSARPQHGAFAGRLWVRDGGVLVLSNIRGGSEYGPAWHQAVLKENRQLAYDDFFAIGEALVADGVTTPAQLGAIGRSNGGLLMGVVLTQRPDLYRAIDIGVPLLDMLRYDKLLAGASWTGEYGDPDVPEERNTLAAYSPYQNLNAETDYPKVLFYTSTRDDRVHPGHARKMAAALASIGADFYYWENIEGGHGGVANQDQAALRIALEFLYFKKELGLD